MSGTDEAVEIRGWAVGVDTGSTATDAELGMIVALGAFRAIEAGRVRDTPVAVGKTTATGVTPFCVALTDPQATPKATRKTSPMPASPSLTNREVLNVLARCGRVVRESNERIIIKDNTMIHLLNFELGPDVPSIPSWSDWRKK